MVRDGHTVWKGLTPADALYVITVCSNIIQCTMRLCALPLRTIKVVVEGSKPGQRPTTR